ncbi:hypothetical protein K1T71_014890 [Dendrolimus kikuchii]|nr:hypothetical protein K1T71_014890 [Dendrolimus kikuchii]
MSVFININKPNGLLKIYNCKLWRPNSTTADAARSKVDDEEFRVLDILKKRDKQQRRTARRTDIQPDRADRMAPDQKWGNVWPGPKTFHPSSVPLALRQGYVPRGQAPPGKKANAELMKIPNFLHLTPPAIKSQCEAIKKYCTEWPKLLNSENAIEQHYPVEVITSDYCHATPSIRNPLARIVTLRIKLSTLELDKHARDKLIRLVGDRYDKETDLITITADSCPVRVQNNDYVNYLLTACYHEAWSYEDWEKDKTEDDMEYYNFDTNPSKHSLVNWFHRCNNKEESLTDEEYRNFDVSQILNGVEYKDAVSSLMNDGESKETVEKYGDTVRKLLGLPARKVDV